MNFDPLIVCILYSAAAATVSISSFLSCGFSCFYNCYAIVCRQHQQKQKEGKEEERKEKRRFIGKGAADEMRFMTGSILCLCSGGEELLRVQWLIHSEIE
jgi:hypothetical protein